MLLKAYDNEIDDDEILTEFANESRELLILTIVDEKYGLSENNINLVNVQQLLSISLGKNYLYTHIYM